MNSRQNKIVFSGSVAKRTALGAFGNFLSEAIRAIEQFFLPPIFLWFFGKVLYGEWLTISSLVVYFSLSDIGTGNFITNKLIQYYSRGEMENYAKTFRSALSLYLAVTAILILPLAVFSFFAPFNDWFHIGAASASAAKISVFIFGLYFLSMALFALLNNLYISIGGYVRYKKLSNIREALVVASIALVLVLGGGFISIASVYLAFIIIFTIFIIFDIKRRYPEIIHFKGKTDWNIAKSFIVPGIVFLAIPLSNIVKIQGGILVVGSALGAAAVVVFSLHRTMSNLVLKFMSAIKPAIQPEITAYEELGDFKKVRLLHNFFLKLTLFSSVSLALFLFFSGKDILKIWVGEDIQFSIYLLAALIALALIDALAQFSSAFQVATNKYFQFSSVTLASSCIGLVLAFFLIKPFGLTGAAFGFFIAELFLDFWIIPKKTLMIIKESGKKILSIMAKGLPMIIAQSSVAFILHRYIQHFWPRVVFTGAFVFILGIAFTYFIWFDGIERNAAKTFFIKFLRPVKRGVNRFLSWVDHKIARAHLALFGERSALSVFIFHSLFLDSNRIDANIMRINPKEAITVDKLREFVEFYRNQGYIFVSPDDILNGLKPGKKYALITFDDGYYNNISILPILRKFKIPALFFITVENVKNGQGFWWDILWRERKKQGTSDEEINKEQAVIFTKSSQEIKEYLLKEFGEKELLPTSDSDRPFAPEELRAFAKEEFVHIGNHTANHADLENLSVEEIFKEISEAQEYLISLIDKQPIAIAYPYGNFSDKVMQEARLVGLQLGFSIMPGKNYLPLDLNGNRALALKRFNLKGEKILEQCEINRSDLRIKR